MRSASNLAAALVLAAFLAACIFLLCAVDMLARLPQVQP